MHETSAAQGPQAFLGNLSKSEISCLETDLRIFRGEELLNKKGVTSF